MSTPFLSIVIPARNEERRLPDTLQEIDRFLKAQTYPAEVIVVENGSTDRTYAIAQEFAASAGTGAVSYSVIHEDQGGKGRAVKRGILAARGAYRFMCDADLSMPTAEIPRFLPPQLEHFDIAIASREARGAIRYDEPSYRHIGGRLVNTMIRLLALPGLHDTQCGFKCFRAEVAEDLFRLQRMTGWSFDIEILFIARKRGYRVVELPIPWYFNPDSKVNAVKDAFKMGIDILKIRRNALAGLYQRHAKKV